VACASDVVIRSRFRRDQLHQTVAGFERAGTGGGRAGVWGARRARGARGQARGCVVRGAGCVGRGARCQALGARCEVPGVRRQAPGAGRQAAGCGRGCGCGWLVWVRCASASTAAGAWCVERVWGSECRQSSELHESRARVVKQRTWPWPKRAAQLSQGFTPDIRARADVGHRPAASTSPGRPGEKTVPD